MGWSRRDRVGEWKEVGRKKRRRGRRWEGRNTETSGGAEGMLLAESLLASLRFCE